jgi:predicted NodU family carbamoyl transferase
MMSDTSIFYNENILGLSLDAGPDFSFENDSDEKKYYVGVYSKKGECEFFNISSPGIIWAEAAAVLGSPEGTLMALAYASESKAYYEFENKKIQTRSDTVEIRKYVDEVIAEIMGYKAEDAGRKYNFLDDRYSEEENKVSMIMKILQELSVLIIDSEIEQLLERYSIDAKDTYIALGGGYSLNCPTNTHIMSKFGFKGQLILPCVNDSGQAIGMGLHYFEQSGEKIEFCLQNAYHGRISAKYSEQWDEYIESVSEGYDRFVDDILEEPILWVNGASEIGPRALGHRSILANATDLKSKDILNVVKQREWWRPVAPLILEECVNDWYEDAFESPYMLNNFKVKKEKKQLVEATLHLDDTARVQTVSEKNGDLYIVLKAFYEKTGIPVMCNTSLNDKGEPIIDNVEEAINFALRKNINVIYFEGRRLKVYNFDKYDCKQPLKRMDDLFVKYKNDEKVIQSVNPYGLSKDEYYWYKTLDDLKCFEHTNENDVRVMKKIFDKFDYISNVKF